LESHLNDGSSTNVTGTTTTTINLDHSTATFNEALASVTVTGSGGKYQITGPAGHETVSGAASYSFTDGTVSQHLAHPLIDSLFYLGNNKDVWAAQADPTAHYSQYGWHEGRDPDAYFSTAGYEAVNGDVRAGGIDPLQHYDQFGWHEGRDPSASFDTTLYLLHNPDVAAAGIDPLAHYLQYGQAEGRQAYAAIGTHIMPDGFDPEYYLLANPDVARAAIASGQDVDTFAFNHYENNGWREGRNPVAPALSPPVRLARIDSFPNIVAPQVAFHAKVFAGVRAARTVLETMWRNLILHRHLHIRAAIRF
jgi:hypothetical protein